MLENKEEQQEEQARQKSPLGQGQLKQKADSTKSKVSKIKKVINFLKRHPLIAKAIFWISLGIILIIIMTSIIYTILHKKFESDTIAYDELKAEMYSFRNR